MALMRAGAALDVLDAEVTARPTWHARNVARIAPTSSAAARRTLAADVFRHFAMCFSDLIVTNRRDPDALVARLEGQPYVDEAARRGQGPTSRPVVPALCVMPPDHRYRVRLREPITVETGGEVGALMRWVTVLEETVRDWPEQWFTFFDCWGAPPGS
jgi:lauroyl/myristoyl acyltransferase